MKTFQLFWMCWLLWNEIIFFLGHRKRSRVVVVPPSALGLECPSLTEVQPCLHPACYSWTVEPWGACQLEPGTGAKCGTGRRTRRVACTTHSDGSEFKVMAIKHLLNVCLKNVKLTTLIWMNKKLTTNYRLRLLECSKS